MRIFRTFYAFIFFGQSPWVVKSCKSVYFDGEIISWVIKTLLILYLFQIDSQVGYWEHNSLI